MEDNDKKDCNTRQCVNAGMSFPPLTLADLGSHLPTARRAEEENKERRIQEGQNEPSSRESKPGLKFDTGKQRWHALPLEILEPLADVFAAGAKKYAKFNCLQPFRDSNERFYDGQMRHTRASQLDPLAIDQELLEQYGEEVYHLAQVAFNALMRLHHARKEATIDSSPQPQRTEQCPCKVPREKIQP
jgi:hypothetical protein